MKNKLEWINCVTFAWVDKASFRIRIHLEIKYGVETIDSKWKSKWKYKKLNAWQTRITKETKSNGKKSKREKIRIRDWEEKSDKGSWKEKGQKPEVI